MMKLFNNKGEIPVATGIMIVLIFFAIPILYFFVIIPYVLDTTNEERFEKAEKIRDQLAEKPLQFFNENIYKNIAFSGKIIGGGHERKKNIPEVYWFTIKLDTPLYNPGNVPIKLPNIYDFTNPNASKIYYFPDNDCSVNDVDAYLSIQIVKKKGNMFYIKNYINKESKTILFCNICYTIEFDYFWTVKDLSKILDTIPKVPIWRK